jgi:trans-aconitate methyltransferase
MQRCLEPELMIDADQVSAFVNGTREYGIKGFLDLYKKYNGITKGKIVDLGSGDGKYICALANEYSSLNITGYDGSPTMVRLSNNVKLCNIYDVVDTADMVISTNTLHHIHDVTKFWKVVKSIAPSVFIMDLVRPIDETVAHDIVNTLAKNDSKMFKQDYSNSLNAAFSVEELEEQIKETNLKLVIEGAPKFLQIAVIYGNIL